MAWRCQSAACALWAVAALAWLAGAPALAGLGRAGFLALAAIGFWLSSPGGGRRPAAPYPGRRGGWRVLLGGGVAVAAGLVLGWGGVAGAAGRGGADLVLPLAGVALSGFAVVRGRRGFARGERAVSGWSAVGLVAIAAADFDAGRGAGSAGLAWLFGFGCLAMAAQSYRGRAGEQARRAALAGSRRELLDFARHAPPAGRPSSGRAAEGVRPGGVLMVEDDAIFEAKRDGRNGVPAP